MIKNILEEIRSLKNLNLKLIIKLGGANLVLNKRVCK